MTGTPCQNAGVGYGPLCQRPYVGQRSGFVVRGAFAFGLGGRGAGGVGVVVFPGLGLVLVFRQAFAFGL